MLCKFILLANSSIVSGPNFRGEVSEGGQTASGGAPCPPVEESQPTLGSEYFTSTEAS